MKCYLVKQRPCFGIPFSVTLDFKLMLAWNSMSSRIRFLEFKLHVIVYQIIFVGIQIINDFGTWMPNLKPTSLDMELWHGHLRPSSNLYFHHSLSKCETLLVIKFSKTITCPSSIIKKYKYILAIYLEKQWCKSRG